MSSGTSAPMSTPIAKAKTVIAGRDWPSQAKLAYSAMTDSPPMSARAASRVAKAAAATRRSRLASSEPTPIAKTMTDSTTDACVTVSPTK